MINYEFEPRYPHNILECLIRNIGVEILIPFLIGPLALLCHVPSEIPLVPQAGAIVCMLKILRFCFSLGRNSCFLDSERFHMRWK